MSTKKEKKLDKVFLEKMKGLYLLYQVYKKSDWKNGLQFDEWLKSNKYL